MMRLTKRSEYGLIALGYMAQRNGRFCPVREIMDELSIPRRILSEVFKELLEARVIQVARGPGGGYRLRESPEQIPVSRLVEILEASESSVQGIDDPLGAGEGLGVGRGMAELRKELRGVLDRFTIARLATGSSSYSQNCRNSIYEERRQPTEDFPFLLK